VPPLRQDDNVIPSASDIPGMLSNLRHPRKRGISIGPQSEADAREYIANRERKRRESRSSTDGNESRPQLVKPPGGSFYISNLKEELDATKQRSYENGSGPFGVATPLATPGQKGDLLKPDPFNALPLTPPASDCGNGSDAGREDKEESEDAEQDHKMFLALAKPRVRYDVEVVTKLVIYAGTKCFCQMQRARLTYSQALLGLQSKATLCSSKSLELASTMCSEQKDHSTTSVNKNDADPVHNVYMTSTCGLWYNLSSR
jgi:hypothetical protein